VPFPRLHRSFTRKFHKTENKRERTIQGNFLIPVPKGQVVPDLFPKRVTLGETLLDTQNLRILAPVNGLASLTSDGSYFQIKQDGAWNTASPFLMRSHTYESFLEDCREGALSSLDFPDLPLDKYFLHFKKEDSFDVYFSPFTRYNHLPFLDIILSEMNEAMSEFEKLIKTIFPNATLHNYLQAKGADFSHPDGIPEYFISRKKNISILESKIALDSRKILYLGPETVYHILRMLYFREPFTRRHLYVCLVDRKGRIDTESRYFLLTNGQSLEFIIQNFDKRYKIASFQSMYEAGASLDIHSLGNFNIYEHNTLLLYERLPVLRNAFPCIDCHECNTYCPTQANPYSLTSGNIENFQKLQCIECGICTLYCPSGIDLRTMILGVKKK
jgi:ferredoxin